MDPIEIFIDYGVIGILILMSILSVAIGIERFSFIKKVRPGDYENIYLLMNLKSGNQDLRRI